MTTDNIQEGNLSDRDIDGIIAETIFGWVLVPVGRDYDGKNACKILAPQQHMTQDWYNYLPVRGEIHKAFACPRYTTILNDAIKVCERVGYDPSIKVTQIPKLDPRALALEALNWYNSNNNTSPTLKNRLGI